MTKEQKVFLIEDSVLNDSKEDIIKKIKQNEPFEFTARALAYACRYREIDIVKCLIENGFTFKYKYSPSIEAKYKVKYGTKTQQIPTDYSVLPIPDYFVNTAYIAYISESEIESDIFWKVYFPRITICLSDYLEETEESEVLKETKKRNSDEALVDILLFLSNEVKEININRIYYYTILCNPKLSVMLHENNICLDENQVKDISLYDQKTLEGLEYRNLLLAAYVKGDLAKVVELLNIEFERYGNNFLLNNQLVNRVLKEGDEQLIKLLLDMKCIGSINKKEIIEYLIDNKKEETIMLLLDYNQIDAKYMEKYLDLLVDNKLVSLTAYIMEKKDKKTNGNKIRQTTINDITPTALLKKTWSTKKQEDGTLCITSYKGEDIEIEVPGNIGKGIISRIGEYAFSTGANRLDVQQLKTRRNLRKVNICEGIKYIDKEAFYGCSHLEEVILPSSLQTIGTEAFKACDKLVKIIIPPSVSDIDETAFRTFKELTPTIIENLVIFGEKDSYAEQFANEHNIAFELMIFEKE